MPDLERVLSRATAKPYRTSELDDLDLRDPFRDPATGLLDFRPGDIENPHNWSAARRWYVTICAVMLVVNATFASSSPSGCLPSISQSFSVSETAASLTVTLFLLGYCAGPLIFAPLSEFYGRLPIFHTTFLLYFCFTALCAWAPNFASLLVGRFLTGTFVSAPLSNAPGVLADLWNHAERGNAMAVFSLMVWVGPALGPVVAGFVQLTTGDWRVVFYVLLGLGGATALLMLTIPETFGPVILLRRARRVRAAGLFEGSDEVRAPVEVQGDRSLLGVYKVALVRPWVILFDPISFLCAVYMTVVYALLYMLFSIYPFVFQTKRGWNAGVGELPLVGTIVGAALGAVIVYFDSRVIARKMEAGRVTPEDRLPLAIIGGVMFPVTMFWFAWTAEFNSIHWIVPTLAGVFLSTALMLIFVAYLNYLVDAYLAYAASAIAANTVCRSAAGAAAPLFTTYMFEALGVGGGGSLIAGVAVLLAVIPFAFYRYGERIRVRSKFAPTPHHDHQEDDEGEGGRQHNEKSKALDEEQGGGVGGVVGQQMHSDVPSPSSSGTTVAGEGAMEKNDERKQEDDAAQNAIGEPRYENTGFGKQG